MARLRLCKHCRGWHELDAWPHNCMDHDYRPRSDYPAPQVISDTIGRGVQSMTNGQWYDSKSALRKEYKQAGVIEVGNDVPKHLGPKIDWKAEEVKRREAIKQAVAEVSSR